MGIMLVASSICALVYCGLDEDQATKIAMSWRIPMLDDRRRLPGRGRPWVATGGYPYRCGSIRR